jgi:hypothetical protein
MALQHFGVHGFCRVECCEALPPRSCYPLGAAALAPAGTLLCLTWRATVTARLHVAI